MGVDKSGRVVLVDSVTPLHPEEQTVEDMLTGWRNQQLCRNLQLGTIEQRQQVVVRFIDYTNEFPWAWTPAMVEEYFGDLRSIRRIAHSTIRSYQTSLKLFCSYISNPDYGWDRLCEDRFGTHPAQVFFDWNTATHVQDNEQRPAKRAFTKTELQLLFDHADTQVETIAATGRKGWLPAYRDAVMLKLAYSYGLRFKPSPDRRLRHRDMNNTGGPVDVWRVDHVDGSRFRSSKHGYTYYPGTIDPDKLTLDLRGHTPRSFATEDQRIGLRYIAGDRV
jgi:hypothetical protein